MMSKMTLYSAWYCPFAQRAWMALLKNNINFAYEETDPYDKNPQWMEVSKGAGQVPVLIDGDFTLTDSTKILTYIDGKTLDESERAKVEYWMDFVNTQVIPFMYRFLKAQTANEQQVSRESMLKGLSIFSNAISDKGPYFSGSVISPVDLSFIPFAYRIKLLLEFYRDFSLDKSDPALAKYHDWYRNMTATDIFNNTSKMMPDYESKLVEFYKIYSEGGGQADVSLL
jgi:glutathione S-transferase